MIQVEKKKVLLVEDESIVQGLCSRLISRLGYLVDVVSGVKSALTYLEGETPDLLVSDLHLMDGGGFDVVKRFQRNCPEGKIIIITGSILAEELRACAMEMGVHDFLVKPFGAEEFEEAIKRNLS